MNETLIKNIIQCKIAAVEKILDKMPPKMSNNLKNLGTIALDCINESSQKIKADSVNKENLSKKLNNINIE